MSTLRWCATSTTPSRRSEAWRRLLSRFSSGPWWDRPAAPRHRCRLQHCSQQFPAEPEPTACAERPPSLQCTNTRHPAARNAPAPGFTAANRGKRNQMAACDDRNLGFGRIANINQHQILGAGIKQLLERGDGHGGNLAAAELAVVNQALTSGRSGSLSRRSRGNASTIHPPPANDHRDPNSRDHLDGFGHRISPTGPGSPQTPASAQDGTSRQAEARATGPGN